MVFPPATKLLKSGVQIDVEDKWNDFVDGGNGCLYGMPWNASRVVEFNMEDKSIKEIGPDLSDENANLGDEYVNGIKANNGSIYCMPYRRGYLLKITPRGRQNAEVRVLREREIPRGNNIGN